MSARRNAIATAAGVVLCTVAACLTPACGPTNQIRSGGDKPLTVTIAPGDEAARTKAPPSDEPALLPRTFAFEMAGFSAPVRDGTPEQRIAATQAAVIDAFCQALIEARRARGQSASDFTAVLGPRLTVRHCQTDDGYQAEIDVISRGVETSFIVRNGKLQHPPHDVKLVQRIFQETNGEFSLLGAEWRPDAGSYVATVGCYTPAGSKDTLSGALAGDAAADPADAPQTP